MNLFYRDIGTGCPLLILHGLFGLSDHWMGIAKTLSDSFRIIIPDLRNHGQSPHSQEFNYDAMSNDLAELLQSLQLSKINLLGHSMGGKLAMTFALKHQQMIEKLMIIDIGIKQYQLSGEMEHLIYYIQNLHPENYSDRAALMAQLNASENIKQLISKNLKYDVFGCFSWKPNVENLIENLHHVLSDIPPSVSYAGKTIFLRGEHSDYILPEDIPPIQKIFPNSRFVTIPDAGHWIHADNPKALISEILSFLATD